MTQNSIPVKDRPLYHKPLIYGHMGAGKTTFAAGAPKPEWFDFERSTETLRYWPEYKDIPTNVPKSVMDLFKGIRDCVNDPGVETIVFDSVTTGLDHYMRQEAEKRASKRDEYLFQQADYKYATQVFTKLFGKLNEAPINVVLIGHERVVRNSDTGAIESIFPDVTPRLQDAVSRLVDFVGYLDAVSIPSSKEGAKRKLYVNRTATIEAKNRLNIQQTIIEQPTWKEIFS